MNFEQLHEQIKPRTGAVKRVLVFFGGVDADNYTGLAIKALAELGLKESACGRGDRRAASASLANRSGMC